MSDGYRTYRCECGKVSRRQEPVEAFVEECVVGRLRMPDLAELLVQPAGGEVDVQALESEVLARRNRLDQAAELFAAGAIDAQQLTATSRVLNAEVAELRGQIALAYSAAALEGVFDAPDPGGAWLSAPLARKRAVLDALMVVTIHPSGKRGRPAGWTPGQSYFRPDSVSIEWRGAR